MKRKYDNISAFDCDIIVYDASPAQRQSILDISMFKLRTNTKYASKKAQNADSGSPRKTEPSLRRSVLIFNTLKTIEAQYHPHPPDNVLVSQNLPHPPAIEQNALQCAMEALPSLDNTWGSEEQYQSVPCSTGQFPVCTSPLVLNSHGQYGAGTSQYCCTSSTPVSTSCYAPCTNGGQSSTSMLDTLLSPSDNSPHLPHILSPSSPCACPNSMPTPQSCTNIPPTTIFSSQCTIADSLNVQNSPQIFPTSHSFPQPSPSSNTSMYFSTSCSNEIPIISENTQHLYQPKSTNIFATPTSSPPPSSLPPSSPITPSPFPSTSTLLTTCRQEVEMLTNNTTYDVSSSSRNSGSSLFDFDSFLPSLSPSVKLTPLAQDDVMHLQRSDNFSDISFVEMSPLSPVNIPQSWSSAGSSLSQSLEQIVQVLVTL